MPGLDRAALGSMFLGVVEVSVRSLAAIALAVGLAASGCSGDPARPTPLGTPTASTSIGSSPTTPTPPSLPPGAEGTSARSAKAFVRYWISVLNYSGPAGDSASLRDLSTSGCVDCDAIADYIDKIYGAGGTIAGSGWDVEEVRLIDRQGAKRLTLDALVNVGPQTVVAAKGKAPTRFKGGHRLKTFWIEHQNAGWSVTRLDQTR